MRDFGVEVSPSLLAVVEEVAPEKVIPNIRKAISQSQSADWYHIDVMDGKFVKQVTPFIDPKLVRQIRDMTDIPLDVHLMVDNPENYIRPFYDAGARMLTFHAESTDEPGNLIGRIKRCPGALAGMALNPDTPLDRVTPYLKDLDMVLLMSVVPGKCGQSYHAHIPEKIRALNDIIAKEKSFTMIEVDGGIKTDNAYMSINAMSDAPGKMLLVSGSGVYGKKNPDRAINAMRDAMVMGSDASAVALKDHVKGYLKGKKIAVLDIGVHPNPMLVREVSGYAYDCQGRGLIFSNTDHNIAKVAKTIPYLTSRRVEDTFRLKALGRYKEGSILCMDEESMQDAYGEDYFEEAERLVSIWLGRSNYKKKESLAEDHYLRVLHCD